MAEEAGKAKFERQLADYKTMVILRQKECVSIAELLETSARLLSRRAKQLKIALIILGVIVATKGGLDAAMTELAAGTQARVILGLAFLLFGAVISVIAGRRGRLPLREPGRRAAITVEPVQIPRSSVHERLQETH